MDVKKWPILAQILIALGCLGGLRKIADLQSIKALGVQHALLASALHSGTINKADIANL